MKQTTKLFVALKLTLVLILLTAGLTSCSSSKSITDRVRESKVYEVKQYVVEENGHFFLVTDYGFKKEIQPFLLQMMQRTVLPKQ